MRQFNQGSNQLPQSSIGVNKFPVICVLKAGETQPTTAYNVFEIDSIDAGIYTVIRPTADSLPNAKVVFSTARPKAEETFTAGMDGVRLVTVEDGDTPDVGDEIGTKEDSYKMSASSTGFIVLDFDSDLKIATTRSNSGSGGGVTTPLQLVQVITSSATSGVVTVKNIELTTNPDSSPNYTPIGTTTFNARRLRS